MMLRTSKLLPLLAQMKKAGRTMPLAEAARFVELSPSHLQRLFAARVRESPAKYQKRLRLERGAAELRSSDSKIIDVAFTAGFESHQAFTRAFSSHFGISPACYRRRSKSVTVGTSRWITESGPCVSLYGMSTAPGLPTSPQHSTHRQEDPMPTSAITREPINETPTVVARRKVDKEHIADALAECLPAAYGYVMEAGLAMAGPPFVRYLNDTAAFFEIEAGIPLLESAGNVDRADLFAGTLPGGEAAIAIHSGPYDSLGETHIAIDRWMSKNDLTGSGGPWEIYLTDPGEVPDPNDWQTQVIWPIA